MRVVVSGATGFLGGRLARALVRSGHDVLGIGRDREAGRRLEQAGIRFMAVDLGQGPEQGIEIGKADAFAHAAGLSSAWGPKAAFFRANVLGTRAALAMAERAEVRRFVFISSPSVTFRFADQAEIKEDAPLPAPVNAYAASKQAAEKLVLASLHLSPVVLRPRAIYGPGDTALLPRLVRAASSGPLPLLRGGRAVTNLTYVDDAVGAIMAALAAPKVGGRIFNIAGAETLAVKTIVEAAAAKFSIPVRWRSIPWPVAFAAVRVSETLAMLRPGRPEPAITAYGLGVFAFTQTLDTSAALRDLGFVPKFAFDEGLDLAFRGTA